jgi:glycosyltransferase involved in cell wall biosynthesis
LLASQFKNIKVISNPDNEQMENLIVNAQINLLPALTTNGFKLKLIMALYAGRHLLVNSVIAEYSSIKNLCHVADSFEEMINKVHCLMAEPFTEEIILERQRVLSENFDVRNNAEKLVELIF